MKNREDKIDALYGAVRRGEIDPDTAFDQITALGGDRDEAEAILKWAPDVVVKQIYVTENNSSRDSLVPTLLEELIPRVESGEITRDEAVELMVRNGSNRIDARELIFPRTSMPYRD